MCQNPSTQMDWRTIKNNYLNRVNDLVSTLWTNLPVNTIIGGRYSPAAEQAAMAVVFSLSAPGVTCWKKGLLKKKRFLRRWKQNRHQKKFVFHICLESQRLWIYKKSVDTLLGEKFAWKYIRQPGKIFMAEKWRNFWKFFPSWNFLFFCIVDNL